MATATAAQADTRLNDVIDAMRSVHTEVDRWNLAESLRTLVPTGTNGFDKIIDEAKSAGVVGKLSAHTLRLYRDTANRWRPADRVANVSFSAHREAMVMIGQDGNTKRAAKLLTDIAKSNGGGDQVTVKRVREAAAVQQGKTSKTKPTSGTAAAAQPASFNVLRDLATGATQLLAALGNVGDGDSVVTLDKLQAGLTKSLHRVEQLKIKAAQRAAKSKTPTTTNKAPAKANAAKKAAGAAKRGDLRNL